MTTPTTTQDPSAIAKRYFAAWEAHDVDGTVALCTRDSQFQAHGRRTAVHGSEALRQELTNVFEFYPRFGLRRAVRAIRSRPLGPELEADLPAARRRPQDIHCLDVVEAASDDVALTKGHVLHLH